MKVWKKSSRWHVSCLQGPLADWLLNAFYARNLNFPWAHWWNIGAGPFFSLKDVELSSWAIVQKEKLKPLSLLCATQNFSLALASGLMLFKIYLTLPLATFNKKFITLQLNTPLPHFMWYDQAECSLVLIRKRDGQNKWIGGQILLSQSGG